MKRIAFSAIALACLGLSTANAQFLPPGSLPGPGPSGMNFGVREIRGVTAPNDLAQIVSIVLAGDGTATDGNFSILDVADPDTNPNGGPILRGAPSPFLTDTPGTDDNDIISLIHGTLEVPMAGQYTIQVRSDDGFGLRFPSIPFEAVHGSGQLDSDGSMVFPGGTGDSNSRGVITLPAGQVNVEMVTWERGGGAFYEVTSAKGVFPNASGAQWLGLGDGSVLGPVPPAPRDVRLVGPATIVNGPDAGSIPDAVTAIRAAVLDPAAPRAQTDLVVIKGDGDICCGRPGSAIADQAVVFPNGGGDNFSTGVFGAFLVDDGDDVLDETIQLTFGLFSDDGSALHIFGESFSETGANGELVEMDGDMMIQFPSPTGNSNTYGLIELKEGTYGFEAFEYENGGDSGLEVWFATGDKRDAIGGGAFYPLSTSAELGAGIPGNMGLQAVPEPSSLVLLSLGLLSILGGARRRS